MDPVTRKFSSLRHTGALALQALSSWSPRQVRTAVAASLVVATVIGMATVLIPNPLFSREIPPVWWNYPVWLLTSALTGMLAATYVGSGAATSAAGPDVERADGFGATGDQESPAGDEMRRTNRMGAAGGVLAWFAVGCPVCNKLAVLALGYSGAITWFAPLQPLLAFAALALTGVALAWRLRGQVACPRPRTALEPTS